MSEALATERLTLPRWEPSDDRLLMRLSADPRVMRFIGDGRVWPAEQAAQRSRSVLQHWTVYGFGWRPIIVRGSERACGFAGLNYLGEGTAGLDPQELEIGWWLEVAAWGHGYASEAARAAAGEAFGRLAVSSVVARVAPANAGSVGVARRLGMVHELDAVGHHGEPIAVYRLSAPAAGSPSAP